MDKTSLSPQYSEFYQKGLAALRKKNYAYAIELFQEVLTAYPDFVQCRHNLWTSVRKNSQICPLPLFKYILIKTQIILLNLKFFYFLFLNNLNSAIAVLEKIILLNPRNISYFKKLGVIFVHKKNSKNAICTFEEILFIDEKNISALKFLARLYFENKDYKKATTTAKILLEHCPHDFETENILKDIAAINAIEKGFDNIQSSE